MFVQPLRCIHFNVVFNAMELHCFQFFFFSYIARSPRFLFSFTAQSALKLNAFTEKSSKHEDIRMSQERSIAHSFLLYSFTRLDANNWHWLHRNDKSQWTVYNETKRIGSDFGVNQLESLDAFWWKRSALNLYIHFFPLRNGITKKLRNPDSTND